MVDRYCAGDKHMRAVVRYTIDTAKAAVTFRANKISWQDQISQGLYSLIKGKIF